MRRTLNILALATGVSIAAISTGFAADLGARPAYKAPAVAPAPMFSWTGFYIGGHVGYGWGRNDWTDVGGGLLGGAPGSTFGNDTDGFLAGGQAGFDWQFAPNWVLGIEGQGSWANLDGSTTVAGPAPVGTFSNDINWLTSVTGRLGFTQNNWMLYVKGGGAWADFDHTASFAAPGATTTASHTRSGWTAGGGFEYAFTPGWSAKVEYQYYDFGSDRYAFPVFPAGASAPTDIDSQIHTVKVGLNWRFGGLGGRY